VILLNTVKLPLGDATSLDASLIMSTFSSFSTINHYILFFLQIAMSNDIAEPRRTGRERKQVEKFEPKRKLHQALHEDKLIDQEIKMEKEKVEQLNIKTYVTVGVCN
jgi:hypothetical protein